MKKAISILLVLMTLMLALTACGAKHETAAPKPTPVPAPTEVSKAESTAAPTDTPAPEPTEEPTPEPTEEPTPEPTEPPVKSDGLRPEFKEAVDAYVAFFEEYAEFMKRYAKNPSDFGLLLQYAEFLSKADEYMDAIDGIDQSELTNAELAYYMKATGRIMELISVFG